MVTVSLREQMLLYDSLPRSLRELYDSLPESEDARNFKAILDAHGEWEAWMLIAGEIKRLYPDWNPPEFSGPEV